LSPSAPRIDQRLGSLGGGDVARDHLNAVGQLLHALDRAGDVLVMAVRGVDHDEVDPASTSASVRAKPLSPTVVAAATHRRPASSLVALGR
jgi:hypothetical protein